MRKRTARGERTLMSGKFYSMLLSGTLAMVVESLLLMSDAMIAGVFVGSDAVAGVTLVTPLYSMAAFFGSVVSLGVPIVYTKEMGRFDKRGADRAFGFGLLMALVVGVLLLIAATLFGDLYLRSSLPSPGVLAAARDYLRWMRFTMLLFPIQTLLLEVIYADGDEGLCTIASAVQGGGNVAASILLSRVMGIAGIGLASFLFNLISLLALLPHFWKEGNSLRPNLYFSLAMLKTVTQYSAIDASTYLFFSIQIAALNAFVSYRFGADALVLVSVIMLSRELLMILDGIGEAISPILGVYLGEGNCWGVREIYRIAERTAILEGAGLTLAWMLIAPFVPRILDIADPALMGYAVAGTRLAALGTVFISLLYLLSSYYLVLERIGLGLAVSAMRDVVLTVLLAVALGSAFGVYGLFLGIAAAPALSYALLLVCLTLRHGRENCPIFFAELQGGVRSALYHLRTEPREIIALQQTVARMLEQAGIDGRTIGRVKLLLEELFLLIREKNGGRAVLCECLVALRPEGVELITKDDGVIFDISQEDAAATSLVAFAVSGYMEKLGQDKRYLTTMSINRSVFLIKKPT